MSISIIGEHLFLVLSAAVLSITIGLPLGVFAYLNPKIRGIVLRIVDLFQTVPALALLGIIMVFIGAGKLTVIIGITLYSLLPIVRNTCLGLQSVDPGVKEAARGMGMSKLYRTLFVELPLAFPTIFTGIRIAVVNAISTAVFAAFVSGGGLGGVITQGIRQQDMATILSATGVLMVIAIVLDSIMGFVERKLNNARGNEVKKIALATATVMVVYLIMLPFGLRTSVADNELLLYYGTYTTDQVGITIITQYIEANTDLDVRVQDQMSAVNVFNQFMKDEDSCDLIMTYDGTLLTTFMKKDPSDVPEGETIYSYANALAQENLGVTLLGKLGFDNTYAIAAPNEIADKYGLETISDLVPVAGELTFGAEHEFFTEEGTIKFKPFTTAYGLNFAKHSSVDLSLKYAAIEQDEFDITEVYSTDGLNRKADLKILEDDLSFFPDYFAAIMVRDDFFEKFMDVAPELEDVLTGLEGQISNDDMINMGYEVDVMGHNINEVVEEFLVSKDLIPAP